MNLGDFVMNNGFVLFMWLDFEEHIFPPQHAFWKCELKWTSE